MVGVNSNLDFALLHLTPMARGCILLLDLGGHLAGGKPDTMPDVGYIGKGFHVSLRLTSGIGDSPR